MQTYYIRGVKTYSRDEVIFIAECRGEGSIANNNFASIARSQNRSDSYPFASISTFSWPRNCFKVLHVRISARERKLLFESSREITRDDHLTNCIWLVGCFTVITGNISGDVTQDVAGANFANFWYFAWTRLHPASRKVVAQTATSGSTRTEVRAGHVRFNCHMASSGFSCY